MTVCSYDSGLAGTYGFCVECKQMIDTDRLAILPTATLCLMCEQKKKK
jgi:RNA polymerase-binding transcription factor DksA